MSDLAVRIVRLEPVRVASALVFGPSPELAVWDITWGYVQRHGLLTDGQPHRFFGFNNPDPSPASPNYGYESWVTVGPEAQPEGQVEIKTFDGGLYAVTACPSVMVIGEVWQSLVRWREVSRYRCGGHQWLEEVLNPQSVTGEPPFTFDLYLPIVE